MIKKKLTELTIILILFFPLVGFCETITLKSGKKVKGNIIERTNEYIKLDFNGTTLYYELKYIRNIEEDEELLAPSQEDASLRDASTYLKQGFEYAAQSRFIEAEQEFKKGLSIEPAHHNLKESLKIIDGLNSGAINKELAVLLFKGSNYLINAEYAQAISNFKQALELNPLDSDLYYYLGVCFYQTEQHPEAITHLEKALEIKPNEEIYYYLGASYYALNQYLKAITSLEKSLTINPNDPDVYSIIGTSYYLLGLFPQAKDNLYKAKELFQKKGDYLKAKDLENFLKDLNK